MYLSTHSYYSFKYGTMAPDQLLEQARTLGFNTLPLTDINSTAGCLEFVRQSSKYGIRPVLGVDFRHGSQQRYIALANNNTGFQEINEHLSSYLTDGSPSIPARAPQQWQHVTVIYPWNRATNEWLDLLPHEWIGVKPTEVFQLSFAHHLQPKNKLIAFPTASFRHQRDFNTHRLLRSIAENKLLSKLEQWQTAPDTDRFYSTQQLIELYKDAPQLLKKAERTVEGCEINFDLSENRPHQNLRSYTGSVTADYELIRKLCIESIPYRYKMATPTIEARLEKELEIIFEKEFVAYFLINWDILRYARSKNYFYVGRGSGANSIVAYLLRITDVDPIELDLYFERFINLYRKSPPDFDLDFSWRDRDDIIAYIFRQFPHAAQLAAYSTFQYKGVRRELGKVFGMPPSEIEELEAPLPDQKPSNKLIEKITHYSRIIQDFPSHLTTHAGGILIAEKPINYFTATHKPSRGFPTTMFDMAVAEDVGLYKFDILSQRGLGKIKDSLQIIQQNRPNDPAIDIHDIDRFKNDSKVKGLLKEGQTIGCFYVESPAMRMLLKKLSVTDYLGLVAASSIIRPGVASSGMMKEYILRFRSPERRSMAHPVMLEVMPETFGIMVYQEDVIKVAHLFGGLSLAESDVLRRGMSGKFRSRDEFHRVKDLFFENCRKKGEDEQSIAEIWYQIESFAGYAFSKGHSASYAVESYQSLFLKAHYPLEYLVATLNNGGGFYRPELYVLEAKRHGATIRPPCVNDSGDVCSIKGTTIIIGLGYVKEIESATVSAILSARHSGGSFTTLEDLIKRTGISLDQCTLLLRVGALAYTGKTNQNLLWEVHYLFGKMSGRTSNSPGQPLFSFPLLRDFHMPPLVCSPVENALDEMELLGFPLCDPFLLLENGDGNDVLSSQLSLLRQTIVSIVGYLITTKATRTLRGEQMFFGTFIDREGSFVDTVHFPPVAKQYPFRGKGFYRISGKVIEEFGCFSIEVIEMEKQVMADTSI